MKRPCRQHNYRLFSTAFHDRSSPDYPVAQFFVILGNMDHALSVRAGQGERPAPKSGIFCPTKARQKTSDAGEHEHTGGPSPSTGPSKGCSAKLAREISGRTCHRIPGLRPADGQSHFQPAGNTGKAVVDDRRGSYRPRHWACHVIRATKCRHVAGQYNSG